MSKGLAWKSILSHKVKSSSSRQSNYVVYCPRQPSLSFTIFACLLHCNGWRYAAHSSRLYPFPCNYHRVISITAQALGHGYGLSNSLGYNLVIPSLSVSNAHTLAICLLWIWLKLLATMFIASGVFLSQLPFHLPYMNYSCLDLSLVMPLHRWLQIITSLLAIRLHSLSHGKWLNLQAYCMLKVLSLMPNCSLIALSLPFRLLDAFSCPFAKRLTLSQCTTLSWLTCSF